MDLFTWHKMYTDLPSKQLKVAVPGDKKLLIVCSEDEMLALEPAAMQQELDEAVAKFSSGRCFIRYLY